jgi:hypothetical protein
VYRPAGQVMGRRGSVLLPGTQGDVAPAALRAAHHPQLGSCEHDGHLHASWQNNDQGQMRSSNTKTLRKSPGVTLRKRIA